MTAKDLKHVYELYIRTTPDALWKAITDPEWTVKYWFGSRVKSDFKPGSRLQFLDAEDGSQVLDGEILESIPGRKLVTTFVATYDPQGKNDKPSRVTWEIEKRGSSCKLTVTHDQFEGETFTYHATGPGWNIVLSGLKTLVETGQPLDIGPAM